MFSNDPNFNVLQVFGYASFAAFGGLLGHLMRTIDKGEKINWGKAIMEGLAAGFVGLIVLLACRALHLDEMWTGVIVGVAGWMGANTTILLLEKLVFKKLGIRREDKDDSDRS